MRGKSWGPVAVIGGGFAVTISALSGWRAVAAVAACAVLAWAVVLFGRRQLGGFTGDVVGASGFCGETAALLIAAVK